MTTQGQYEQQAVAASVDSGYAVVWKSRSLAGGIKQYRIYRIHRGARPTLIKVTTSAATLARTMRTATVTVPRKNPVERTGAADARRLVERYTGRSVDPDEYELVPTPPKAKALAQIGKISAIEYVAFRDDKEYRFRHVFKSKSRPALAVAPDGKTVTMIGGSWKFGEDGFEDQ